LWALQALLALSASLNHSGPPGAAAGGPGVDLGRWRAFTLGRASALFAFFSAVAASPGGALAARRRSAQRLALSELA
jgi:hypothetical protein